MGALILQVISLALVGCVEHGGGVDWASYQCRVLQRLQNSYPRLIWKSVSSEHLASGSHPAYIPVDDGALKSKAGREGNFHQPQLVALAGRSAAGMPTMPDEISMETCHDVKLPTDPLLNAHREMHEGRHCISTHVTLCPGCTSTQAAFVQRSGEPIAARSLQPTSHCRSHLDLTSPSHHIHDFLAPTTSHPPSTRPIHHKAPRRSLAAALLAHQTPAYFATPHDLQRPAGANARAPAPTH